MMEILTEEDRKAIEQALRDTDTIRKEIARAKRAGIDVTDMEKRLAEAELALRNLQRVYFAKK